MFSCKREAYFQNTFGRLLLLVLLVKKDLSRVTGVWYSWVYVQCLIPYVQQPCYNSHIETYSIPRKNSVNSGMVHFTEINQAPSPYPMLQYIGRVATPKFVSRNCLRYLQTTVRMGEGELVSEFT